jgi:spore maturation protein CgeB
MFISPEEVFGLPSINVFEGMACGSALVAIDDQMYKDLGLIPSFHYITYKENDLNDLLKVVQYYQNHPAALELIARQGCEFIREHFNEESVAKTFWKDLEYFSNKFEKGEPAFQCSFNI